MESNYTIKKLIQLFLSKIYVIIILTIVGGAAAFGFSKFFMSLKYQSYTSMYVKNNNSVTETDGVNLNDLNASKSLVSTYIAVMQDDAVMEKVGSELLAEFDKDKLSKCFSIKDENGEESISAASIRNCLTMAAVGDTEVMKITAETADPEVSAALCNIISNVTPDFLIRVVGAGSVEAIGTAKVNNNPVSPNFLKMAVIGAFAGMLLAALIILVIDFFDNTVKDKEEIAQKYEKAIIGEIPEFIDDKKKKKDSNNYDLLLTQKGIPFTIKESYKSMRTNVMFSLSVSEKKVIVVSSANPGEGKSTTAANLAITFSQMEHKVLLIDADMRKPVQHKIFGLKNKKGLSSIIGKMNKFDECVNKNVVKSLDILTSGTKPANPSELLASEQAAELLNTLSEDYDYIIVDTPPVNIVSDAMGLSNSIAGILMVLRYGRTTFDDLDNAMKKIELADVKMLGFILNDISKKHGSYSKYGYNYKSHYYDSYGYGEETSEDKDESKKDKSDNKVKKEKK